jgi:hypothetical protein
VASVRQRARPVERARPPRRLRSVAAALLVTAAAAAPRLVDPAAVVTVDETRWLARSRAFADAVAAGRFADTIATGHPGVTVMWAGGLAQRTLPDDAGLRERYGRARLALGVLAVALIVAIWALARSLLGEATALLAGLVLALDPFLVSATRVVGMDGLLALLVLASLLALLRGLRRRERGMLVASGVLGGLALLTKIPALVLLPTAVAVVRRRVEPPLRRRALAAWLLPFGATVLALWPALWVVPWRAAAAMIVGTGGAAHEVPSGRLLVGGPLQPLLFYPVTFLWRSTPTTLLGAALALGWWARRRLAGPAATLLAFALGFTLLVTVAPKHLDRYLLPAVVAADVAAAHALVGGLRRASDRGKRALAALGAAAALAAHAAPVVASHPYEVAAYNPALGGAAAARHVLVVGLTGEGLDRAAEDLNRLPGAERLAVATTFELPFREFFRGVTVPIDSSLVARPDGRPVDLVLFYFPSLQTGAATHLFEPYRERRPVYELWVMGIPYVRVYRAVPARG